MAVARIYIILVEDDLEIDGTVLLHMFRTALILLRQCAGSSEPGHMTSVPNRNTQNRSNDRKILQIIEPEFRFRFQVTARLEM